MNLNPKMRRLAGVGAAALVFVGAWFLAISPQREAAAELREMTAAEEQAASALRTKIASLKKLSEQIPAQQAMLAELNRQVPGQISVADLVRTFTKTAKQTRISLSSIKPGTPTMVEVVEPAPTAVPTAAESASAAGSSAENPQEDAEAAAAPAAPPSSGIVSQPFTLSLCGSYTEIRDFLSAVEALPRAVMVTSLNISKGCDESGDNALAVELGSAVYARLPQAGGPGSSGGAGGDAS